MHQSNEEQVDATRDGQRVDNFLIGRFKQLPKSRIYRALRTGEIRINKKRVKADYRLKEGDRLRFPPFWNEEEGDAFIIEPTVGAMERLKRCILHEDQHLLVIDKPSGVAVHGGSGVAYGVIEILRAAFPQYKDLELIHRLDRDTSGVLLLSKKRSTLKALHRLLEEVSRKSGKIGKKRGIEKTYLGLLKGRLRKEQRVSLPLLKYPLQSGERRVKVSPEGKPSVSVFRPLQVFGDTTLAEIELYTGRTHQIRVHAKAIDHPIAGDEKYGDKEFNKKIKALGVNRLFLHATRVAFTLPDTEQRLTFTSELEPTLLAVLERLSAIG